MVWQTVTILVLSCAILVLTAVAAWGWRTAWTIALKSSSKDGEIVRLKQEAITANGLNGELQDINAKLRLELQRITLTPKPKPVENATKQPRTSAEVRKMTERAFGRNDIQ